MVWGQQLQRLPSAKLEEWPTNERIEQEWVKHTRKRGAKNTQRNHITYGGVFLRTFTDPITVLEPQDIEAFVAQISSKCSKHMASNPPQCLYQLPIATCPIVAKTPLTSCPSYKPLDPQGVWSYICSINRMYEWLLEEGRVKRNPCLPVMRDFASRHSQLFEERRRKPRRRRLTIDEVKVLVQRSPIHLAIRPLVMTKCFLRIHELYKLSFHPDYYNLDEGWMDIPINGDIGNKRKGNHRIIIDAELKPWMRRYKAWWDDHVQKKDGIPITTSFQITTNGRPYVWGPSATQNFNIALQKRCVDLGLMKDLKVEKKDKVTSHLFRSVATTYAKDHGVGAMDLMTLRGDLGPGSTDRYDDYLRRLPALYRNYAPVLGL